MISVYFNNINNVGRLNITLSQWLLHFLASFLAPPDMSSELQSASSAAFHMQLFKNYQIGCQLPAAPLYHHEYQ
jgi:hypothetical protein